MHKSKLSFARKAAALATASLVLTACNTSGGKPTAPPPAPQQQASAQAGVVPDYCPQVSLREGTAILRKGSGDDLQYIASIASTTRACRVRDGELYMEVGVAGRLVPGLSARAGSAELPIRVAVLDSGKVVYSQLGKQSISTDPSGGPKEFRYVDRAIRIPVPAGRTLVVYAGFDEGPQAGSARKPGS
ncbi:hypothetical protein [Aureimonas sp. ME7]|uniref:hypothetical protein n=1 Tax=Aureimonas sp. ME7 TaxID=2744252 RepID=UPI0015F404DE|nr:hypothetical protein [Aureimonas sp. ME7]